jgi:hypothetical protein
LICVAVYLCQAATAAVTFTVAPASVSNSYTGVITFQIGGGVLTNGEKVEINKYLDANTNGVIDAADWLVQNFKLTIGQAQVIGGVTNINVPFSTPASGSITSQVNFATSGFAQQLVGKYIYQLVSRTGHFTPITAAFTVTSASYSQSFTGNVVTSGVNVPYAAVLLFPVVTGGGSPIAGTVADSSGKYILKGPPGTYQLVGIKTNYVSLATPLLTLGAGATVATNVNLLPATQSISGQIVDAANTNGIGGILIAVQSQDRQSIAIGFSDTNGNFNVGVTTNIWRLDSDRQSVTLHGYVGLQNKFTVDTTTGSVSGVTIALPKATSLFYGNLTDAQSHPLVGADVAGYDNNNQYEGDGLTDQNGNYAVAAIGGSGTQWSVQPDNTQYGFTSYLFSQANTNITDGQAIQLNFVGIIGTNLISGQLQDAVTSNGIANVGVYAYTSVNSNNFNQSATTDTNGNYSFSVVNGSWNVGLNCGSVGNGNLPASYLCPLNTQPATISNNNATVNFAVIPATNFITGYVTDTNSNPVANVNVFADATLNSIQYNQSSTTGTNGFYSINVANGSWSVGLDCSGDSQSLSNLGFQCVNNQTAGIANTNVLVNFTVQPCGPVQIQTSSPLPGGQVGVYYSTMIQATGCNQPFNWSLSPGSPPLPSWINFQITNNSTAVMISGTPDTAGTTNFSVRVTDSTLASTDQVFSLTINPSCSLQVVTTSLPDGVVGMVYSQQVSATCGQPPYFWSLSPGSPPLPTWLSLDPNAGTLSGTPPATGTTNFSVRVTDAATNTVDQPLSITILNALPTYTITASAGANGSILPSGSITTNAGVNLTFTATPAANFTVDTWSVDSAPVQTGGANYTLMNIQAAHTVSVTFKPITYTLTVSAGANGSILPNGSVTTNDGSSVTFTATPSANFTVDKWSVDGTVVQAGGGNYILTNIQAAHTVSVTFKSITYTLTVSAGANGSILPNGSVTTNAGSSVTFTATPAANYTVDTWSVDSAPVQTGGANYTLTNIQGAHTVLVTFKPITYTLTVSAGTNGSILPNGSVTTNAGASVTFTATPSANYVVSTWSVDSVTVQTGGANYTLTNIQGAHTVSVTFLQATTSVAVSPAEFVPVVLEGQNAAAEMFEVWNAGNGSLSYTISTNAAWLSVSPTSGNSSGGTNAHTVSFNTASLSNGVYDATITISSPQAVNTQQTIGVTLYVADSFDQTKKPVRLSMKMNFKAGKLDSASLMAAVDLPVGFSVSNVTAQLSIGHVTVPFILIPKKTALNGASSLRLKAQGKPTSSNQVWAVTAKIQGDLNSEWAMDGLVNATTNTPVTVPVLLLLESNPEQLFYVVKPLNYKAKTGKTGTAK